MERGYRVNAVDRGTVIDHLSPGTALKAHRALGLPEDVVVTIGINLESKKLQLKDIIKIENVELGQTELNKLALISPRATLSIIREYEVVQKFTVEMPDEFVGLVRCSNPSCITNHEETRTRFHVESHDPVKIRCHFCERVIPQSDLEIVP